jgi:iron(III) transport system substrate-binding protein
LTAPRRPRWWALLLALILAALSFACALPRAETLTILSTLSERQSRAVAEAFQRETGIRTLYVRIASAEAPQRLAIERGRPFFSVWWGGELEDIRAAAEAGWLEPYLPPGAEALPPALRDPDGRWFAVYLDPVALAAHRARLAQRGLAPPTSWATALSPIYRGELLLPHPGATAAGYATLAGLAQLPGGETAALAAYRAAVPRYEKSGLIAIGAVAAGEAGLSAGFASDIHAYRAASPDLDIVFPSEGSPYRLRAAALARGAKQPAEARRFLDWSLGPSALAATRATPEYLLPANPPARESASGGPEFAGLKLMDYDPTRALHDRPALTERFQREVAPPP